MNYCIDRSRTRAGSNTAKDFRCPEPATPGKSALQIVHDQIEKNLHRTERGGVPSALQHFALHQAVGHTPELIYQAIKKTVPTLLAQVGPALKLLQEVHLPLLITFEFVRGLHMIGQANRDGARLARERNFIGGFFGVLVTGLANQRLSAASARNFVLQHTGWVTTLREQIGGELPTINHRTGFRSDLIDCIERFEAGAQTAKLVFDRLATPRGELLEQIQREFGPRGLTVMYEYYLQSNR